MPKLIKITRISRIPGSPGLPGDPGYPAIPGYWDTTIVTFGGSAPQPSAYFDDATGKWKYILPPTGSWGSTSVTVKKWVPPIPAIPPTPGTPGTPSQTTTDFNLGWNAGATGKATAPGDCALTFRVSPSAVGIVAGLNALDEGSGYLEIDHGIYFFSGSARVIEGGQARGSASRFVAADEFSVARAGTVVTYLKNGAVFYTSDAASAGTVFADASLYAGGDEILDAAFEIIGTSGPPATVSASVSAVLAPLQSLSATGIYIGARSVLQPIRTESGSGGLQPQMIVSNASLAYFTGYARLLSGVVCDVDASLLPVASLSADAPYTTVSVSLEAIASQSAHVLTGDHASLSSAAPVVRMFARDTTGEFPFRLIQPASVVRMTGGARMALQSRTPAVSMTVATAHHAIMALVQPPTNVVMNVATQFTARMALRPRLRSAVSAHSGASCHIASSRPVVSITATWTAPASMALSARSVVAITAIAHRVSTMALMQPESRLWRGGALALVHPGIRVSMVGAKTAVITYEAYSVNLLHTSGNPQPVDEVTRYTNFPFNQIVRFRGDYFGVAADGLYKLGGVTDDGEPITYTVKTCADDFKAPELKNVASAYLTGRLGPLTVSLYAGEDGAQAYDFDTPRGPLARTHREKFGRGVKNRYFALGLAGDDALELDGMELEINKTSRRI